MADETKLETFQRLFPPRATKVLDAIRVASHCMKPHMEADTGMTDQFVRDVREAMDVFPPLGEDILSVSIPGLDDVDEKPPANCYVVSDNGPNTDDLDWQPTDPEKVTIGKAEFDRLKALELDRAKVAFGLTKLDREGWTEKQRQSGIALIKEGIGRNPERKTDG